MRNSSSLDWLRFMHTPNDYRVSREKAYATGTDAIHCCLIPLAGYYFFSVSPPFGLHGSGKIEPVKKSC